MIETGLLLGVVGLQIWTLRILLKCPYCRETMVKDVGGEISG